MEIRMVNGFASIRMDLLPVSILRNRLRPISVLLPASILRHPSSGIVSGMIPLGRRIMQGWEPPDEVAARKGWRVEDEKRYGFIEEEEEKKPSLLFLWKHSFFFSFS